MIRTFLDRMIRTFLDLQDANPVLSLLVRILIWIWIWIRINPPSNKNSKKKLELSESGSVSISISQRYGSGDPDPHQNVTDPQHWFHQFGVSGSDYNIYNFLNGYRYWYLLTIFKSCRCLISRKKTVWSWSWIRNRLSEYSFLNLNTPIFVSNLERHKEVFCPHPVTSLQFETEELESLREELR
jgi:hypothetical protein